MRNFSTDAEKRPWRSLRNRRLNGFKFRRQIPIGNYIIDFYCHDAKLAIEADGGQHSEPAHLAYDRRRTEFLERREIHVIRFWDHHALKHTDAVKGMIYRALMERTSSGIPPHPNPLPKGEGVRSVPNEQANHTRGAHLPPLPPGEGWGEGDRRAAHPDQESPSPVVEHDIHAEKELTSTPHEIHQVHNPNYPSIQ
jgi:very-short-patch-repair endonuclease